MFTTVAVVLGLLLHTGRLAAQEDTTTQFPLGLWGIWINFDRWSPWPPDTLTADMWVREKANFTEVGANFMVNWHPYTFFSRLMDYADTAGYKIDMNMESHGNAYLHDLGLQNWVTRLRNDSAFTPGWHDTVDARILYIRDTYGQRPSMGTYFIGHEGDFWGDWCGAGCRVQDTSHWKGYEYVINKAAELDGTHKSYAIHWGCNGPGSPFPFGITVEHFARRFPHLGIYQMDHYPFWFTVEREYGHQQAALDALLCSYTDCMNGFRNGKTEWHAVIQTQREYEDTRQNRRFRLPTREEVRVQAFLALSRGARGITSFVYGSNSPAIFNGSVVPPAYYNPHYSLLGQGTPASGYLFFDGLVLNDSQLDLRLLHTNQNDPESDSVNSSGNVIAVYQELKPLGPTLRKLRVYDAFPRTAIPVNNIARISGVSGDKIELGVFRRIDRGADSSVYFMLVNRVCNDSLGNLSQPQQVTVTFNATDSRLITEVVSGQAWVVAPGNGSFTVTLDPGSGKLFSIEPALIASHSFPHGVRIGPGATLEVDAGATVSMGENQAIIVDGTLKVKGTAQMPVTLTSTTGKWDGITDGLAAPNVSLDYAAISNAYTGVNLGNWSTLTVDHASFTGCDIGVNIHPCNSDQPGWVRISNSSFTAPHMSATAVMLGSVPDVILTNNAFTGGVHKGAGVYLDASSPQLLGNAIEYFKYGVACTNGSSPMLEEQDAGGLNLLRNNNTAVHCEQGSDAVLGEAEDGGQNIVCMNTTDVAVYESSVSATNNSWRSLEDPPGVFEVYDGDLDYAHWLPPDPNCGGSSAPVAVGKSVLEAESMGGLPPVIRTILEKRRRGLYDDALRMIRALLTDRSTTREAKRRVLGQLLAVGQRTRGGDLSGFLTRLRQSEPLFTRQVSGLLPAVYLHEGSPEAALAACEANIREYPGSSLARGGWYGKFTHALYLRHDTVEARRVLERLQEGFAGSVQAEMAQLQLNTIRRVMVSARAEGTASGMAKGTNAAPGIPAEFALSQNYPNPFNPTTTMRFELPEPARVSLTVYDVLGRVVETLLDETKEAGYHTVRWNAGARSSGVYLARFIATTAAGTVALQQTLKLVLAK